MQAGRCAEVAPARLPMSHPLSNKCRQCKNARQQACLHVSSPSFSFSVRFCLFPRLPLGVEGKVSASLPVSVMRVGKKVGKGTGRGEVREGG